MDVKAVIGRIRWTGRRRLKKIYHEKSAEVIVPRKREGPNDSGQSKSWKEERAMKTEYSLKTGYRLENSGMTKIQQGALSTILGKWKNWQAE